MSRERCINRFSNVSSSFGCVVFNGDTAGDGFSVSYARDFSLNTFAPRYYTSFYGNGPAVDDAVVRDVA